MGIIPYVDRSRVTNLLILIAVSVALGGFADSYDTGVIGDVLNAISTKLTISEVGFSASASYLAQYSIQL